jgi:putative hydrolase
MVLAENETIAAKLREIADLLEQQKANRFRVQAYRRAAGTVDALSEGVRSLYDREGMNGLESLPGVGRGIARTLFEMIAQGRSSRLENLRGELDPERLFRTIPGVGPELARRIHDTLQLDTLEALEVAAHDGRLERVSGLGPRRAEGIRAALGRMLGSRLRRLGNGVGATPPISMLLDVDLEYRDKVRADALPRIAPRRFNPQHENWLPVLHTARDGWHFTALFSNTARAHQLQRTRDWVVIFYYDDQHHQESQSTVVTETRGALTGCRVVRGREPECLAWYERGREAD